MTVPVPVVDAPDVLVAVPARDEEDAIEACLAAVVAALEVARTTGRVARVRVAVAAHRCRDATAERARTLLRASGLEHVVVDDERSSTVGEVRSALVRAALRTAPGLEVDRTWLLSTDADTVVGPDWVTGLLDVAARTGADLVAGFVALDGWRPDRHAAAAYDEILQAGLTAEGHRHVWAANLAVSAAAFEAAGGFPSVVHGEERVLAEHVAAAGGLVVGSLSPVVMTSARMPGRAAHGLGDLLRRLSADDGVAEAS
ncbi:glycosyltransferase [Microlunatus flavus]|uniref:4,4'-diaponeurosporenoate glycosyltransferase n=1 Tax=Microlunatus flavus TaxID=1036181 RepID=A0A1H9C8Z8_9ACTN|nr:glycosyltransferase [Microlunatus flavus]SEP97720.1 Glycosyltransferase like family 2 [Microlunatus flavus]